MNHVCRRDRPFDRAPFRGVAASCLLLLGLLAGDAEAGVAVTPLADYDFGSWSPGSGTVATSRDFCAVSVVGNRLTANNANQLRPWSATVRDDSGASSASVFRIEHADGDSFVELELRVQDQRSGVEAPLTPMATATDMTGDELGCPRGGPNGRLTLRVLNSALAAARSGTFEGSFTLEINGGSNGNQTDATSFAVRIDVPDLVRISNLDDIALGFYSGSGAMVGSDAVCVYRNDPGGSYTVEASGQGAGSAFVLAHDGAELGFTVDYSDGNDWRAMTAGGVPLVAQNANSTAPDCGGMTNAGIRVRIEEEALANAEPGTYAGSLTLTVAPL